MLVCQYPVCDTVGAGSPQKVYSYSPDLEICSIHGIWRFITCATNHVLWPCSEPIYLSRLTPHFCTSYFDISLPETVKWFIPGRFSSEILYAFPHNICMMHAPPCLPLSCLTLLAADCSPAGRPFVYAEPLGPMMGRQLLNELKDCGAHKNNCSVEVANCTCKGIWDIVLL